MIDGWKQTLTLYMLFLTVDPDSVPLGKDFPINAILGLFTTEEEALKYLEEDRKKDFDYDLISIVNLPKQGSFFKFYQANMKRKIEWETAPLPIYVNDFYGIRPVWVFENA